MENPSRRRVLAAGLAGGALGLVGRRVSAGTTPPTSPPLTTAPASTAPPTTEAPGRPTPDDVALLVATQQVELAARDLYKAAIDAGADGDGPMGALRDHHAAFGNVISGLIGGAATQQRSDELFDALASAFQSDDEAAVSMAGYDLESSLVATHTELLGQLRGQDAAKVIASILVIEARHCTVLADVGGAGDDLDALFVNSAEPLTLTPVEG